MNPLLIGEGLSEDKEGTPGWRLRQISEMEPRAWTSAFDRVTTVNIDRLVDRLAIIFGHEARKALGLPPVPWILPQDDDRGFEWRLLPHPSGRNQWYNDPTCRAAVGMLLREIANVELR